MNIETFCSWMDFCFNFFFLIHNALAYHTSLCGDYKHLIAILI